MSKNCRTIEKGITYAYLEYMIKKIEKIIKVIIAKNFPKLMRDTEPQIQKSENSKQDKYQKSKCKHIIFKLENIQDKEIILKEATKGLKSLSVKE